MIQYDVFQVHKRVLTSRFFFNIIFVIPDDYFESKKKKKSLGGFSNKLDFLFFFMENDLASENRF